MSIATAPRSPVLVGVGQVLQRAEDPREALEPLALMAEAARRAAADAGSLGLLAGADSIFVPKGLWGYANPAAWLGEEFGCTRPQTATSPISGTSVQKFVNCAALDIAAGKRDIVWIVGGEAEHSSRRARAAGVTLSRTERSAPPYDLELRDDHQREAFDRAHAGALNAATAFALFETARRHHLGESVQDHRRRLGELWHRFAKVAESNPYAWIRSAPSAAEIAEPSETNRIVATPYTKFLVANMVVDMAAAVVMCSAETAQRLGVPEERWVYPWSSTVTESGKSLSTRLNFVEEPAMRIAGARALELAGISVDALGPVDLYSCFPIAVQLAATELGVGLDGPPTLTGGLTFGGGPLNSYVLHSLATLVERLRREPDRPGLISSIGGIVARHAFGVYAREPAPHGFRTEDSSALLAALPGRDFEAGYTGPVEIESPVAAHGGSGSGHAIVAALTPSGARTWARSEEPGFVAALVDEDWVGRPARVDSTRRLVY